MYILYSDVSGSTRIAYIMRLHDDSSVATWSAAVSLLFTMTPRTRKQVTRSMSWRGGGGADGGARLRHAEKTISVLSQLSRRLFAVSHVCRCYNTCHGD